MGLPGAGKTTLAKMMVSKLRHLGKTVVHLNADEIRANVHKDLGFSPEDRIENATRLGWLASKISSSGVMCVCDFVCPTEETRAAFDADVTIFVDTISSGRFEDTNKLFERPKPTESLIVIDHHVMEDSGELDQILESIFVQ